MAETETKLAYRLGRLNTEERQELLARLGMARSTLWARLQEPGKFTLNEATTITRFLEELDGEDYDMLEMLRPIQLT